MKAKTTLYMIFFCFVALPSKAFCQDKHFEYNIKYKHKKTYITIKNTSADTMIIPCLLSKDFRRAMTKNIDYSTKNDTLVIFLYCTPLGHLQTSDGREMTIQIDGIWMGLEIAPNEQVFIKVNAPESRYLILSSKEQRFFGSKNSALKFPKKESASY